MRRPQAPAPPPESSKASSIPSADLGYLKKRCELQDILGKQHRSLNALEEARRQCTRTADLPPLQALLNSIADTQEYFARLFLDLRLEIEARIAIDQYLSALEAAMTANLPEAIRICKGLFHNLKAKPETWSVKQERFLTACYNQIKQSPLYSAPHKDPEKAPSGIGDIFSLEDF